MPELEALRQRAREIDELIAAKRAEIAEIEHLKGQVQQEVKVALLEAAQRFGIPVAFEPPQLRKRPPSVVRKLGVSLQPAPTAEPVSPESSGETEEPVTESAE